jgi:hypothetical protein
MPHIKKRLPSGITSDGKFWEDFEKFCMLHCNQQDILYLLNTTAKSLSKKTEEYYGLTLQQAIEKFRAVGITSIRRVAFEKAAEGDSKLIMYLLNNYTECKSNPDTQVVVNNTVAQSSTLILSKDEEYRLAQALASSELLDTLYARTMQTSTKEVSDE